jgi:hypothetical protein
VVGRVSVAVSGYDIAKKLRAIADGMPKAAQQGVVKAAAIMESSVTVASGKYARSKLVRTRTTFLPPVGAQVRMVSPKAHLLDHDTKAHGIKPRRAAFMVFTDTAGTGLTHRRGPGGVVFATSVKHPGTTGKLMWEKALVIATPKMEEAMSSAIGNQIVKNFS